MRNNKTKTDPRPICPECGSVVNPKGAAVFFANVKAAWILDLPLIKGIYCSSDHLLDAYLRGYPKWLFNHRVNGHR